MKTAIDSDVVFDLRRGGEASLAAREALAEAGGAGSQAICPVVYAEVAVDFADQSELLAFMSDLTIHMDGFSPASLWEASRAWLSYVRNRRSGVQCSRCGRTFEVPCPSCRALVSWRHQLIPDFLVGGHAWADADQLMTRDTGYFQSYFPQLRLVTPSEGG